MNTKQLIALWYGVVAVTLLLLAYSGQQDSVLGAILAVAILITALIYTLSDAHDGENRLVLLAVAGPVLAIVALVWAINEYDRGHLDPELRSKVAEINSVFDEARALADSVHVVGFQVGDARRFHGRFYGHATMNVEVENRSQTVVRWINFLTMMTDTLGNELDRSVWISDDILIAPGETATVPIPHSLAEPGAVNRVIDVQAAQAADRDPTGRVR